MNRVLVTGGAGFIGSHLIETLASKQNNSITSLDDYSTGSEDNHVNGVHYIRGTTAEINDLINVSPDIVYHLGEYSRVEQSFSEIDKVWKANSHGTFEVIKFCKKHSSKLIYAGSSTKFGDGGVGRTQTPYGWTKATNTELVRCFSEWFGLDYAVTYFYNVYGDREIQTGKYATLIGIFTNCLANNKPLPVVKPGNQKRNFTHIDDIVSGLIKVGENGTGDNYGIGNDVSFTILEVAEMFGETIEWLPERKGNRFNSEIDTSKMRAIGWKCQISLENYIQHLKANNWQTRLKIKN
tara:strand:- start:21141 stop:22025 length:885 start_codon:yes stop_codon:yes gene_type:complete